MVRSATIWIGTFGGRLAGRNRPNGPNRPLRAPGCLESARTGKEAMVAPGAILVEHMTLRLDTKWSIASRHPRLFRKRSHSSILASFLLLRHRHCQLYLVFACSCATYSVYCGIKRGAPPECLAFSLLPSQYTIYNPVSTTSLRNTLHLLEQILRQAII